MLIERAAKYEALLEAEQQERAKKDEAEKANRAWQATLEGYGKAKGELKVKDFDDAEDIKKYVKDRKAIEEAKGLVPVIHLRGDQGVAFRHVRKVIRAAAVAGVDNVIFSVYGFEN